SVPPRREIMADSNSTIRNGGARGESNVAPPGSQDRQRGSRTSPWPRYDEAALGFRNYWYPAMMSRKLRSRPVPVTILGEKLLFIRHQGKCFALEDRCAHRGMPLAIGRGGVPRTHPATC